MSAIGEGYDLSGWKRADEARIGKARPCRLPKKCRWSANREGHDLGRAAL